jgi:ribosomal protein S18
MSKRMQLGAPGAAGTAAAVAPAAAPAAASPAAASASGLSRTADAPTFEEPPRLHPLRLFYPGQTYKPEDLDVDLSDSAAAFVHRPSQKTRQLHKRGQAANAELYSSADFRNGRLLSGFISEAGKLLPRRTNKVCALPGAWPDSGAFRKLFV